MKETMLVLLALTLALALGCTTSNNAQSHGLIGAGIGAAAGALLNKSDRGKGAGIGAAAGGVLGYIIGNEKDKAEALQYQEEERLRQQRLRQEQSRTGTVRTTTITEILDEAGNVVRTGRTSTTSTTRDSNYVDVNDYRRPK